MAGVEVKVVAAFLGLTEAGVRSIIHRRGIRHVGKRGNVKLYDGLEIIRHAGPHDRLQK